MNTLQRLSASWVFLLVMHGLVPCSFAVTMRIEITSDEADAPIYVLNGTAETTFVVDGNIDVVGSFIFSMDDAASPNVIAFGDYDVTRNSDWDADLRASSTYRISAFGELISVRFNHFCQKRPGGRLLMENYECETGQILSAGTMSLVSGDPYFLSGTMRGYVQGQIGGRTVKNCKYSKVPFTQSVDIATADWGDWSGVWDLDVEGSRIAGSGSIQIGPDSDPVETVPQTIGKGNLKSGIYSWTAAGVDSDKKVRVKITHNASDLEPGRSSVSAASQNRKF